MKKKSKLFQLCLGKEKLQTGFRQETVGRRSARFSITFPCTDQENNAHNDHIDPGAYLKMEIMEEKPHKKFDLLGNLKILNF